MTRVKIFEPCDMEYDVYDKPVRFTEEFLKELASNCIGANLVFEEHLGEGIGNVSNLTFTDGGLYAEVNSDKPLDDLKYSPSFDSWLVDEGDHWLATKGRLLEVALTSNPRQAILNNTADDDKGGSRMSDNGNDGTLEFFQNEVKRLQQENNKLEFKLNQANDKIKGFEEKETELEELRAWKTTNEKVIEEQKPIIEKYKAQQEKHREELLETVSQGDSQLREQFESFSTENLETLVGMHVEEQPAHGVGADNAPGLNEGDGSNGKPTEEELKQKEADDALEFFKKLHNGETPSFLKQEGGE